MSQMSDRLEFLITSHIFGSGTFSKPTVLAFALCSGEPTDAMTGATIPELPNAGAYARQTLNPGLGNWDDPVTSAGTTKNMLAITFPVASADWGWVSGVAICDNATYGAGNMLIHGALTTPKLVQNGDQFRFASGDLQVTAA